MADLVDDRGVELLRRGVVALAVLEQAVQEGEARVDVRAAQAAGPGDPQDP